MVLPSPAHGAPLPQVDQESSTKDKLGLYRTLFAGRSDVYAYRWENAADGTKGWSPKRRPGTTRDNPEYLPLTDDVITAHLTKDNPTACGLYAMLTDSTCRLLICDFDGGTWRLDAAAYAEAAAWAGVPPLLRSPSQARALIEKAGSRLAITDLRSAPAELAVMFSGTLRAEQRVAVDAVAAHELGVLVAR